MQKCYFWTKQPRISHMFLLIFFWKKKKSLTLKGSINLIWEWGLRIEALVFLVLSPENGQHVKIVAYFELAQCVRPFGQVTKLKLQAADSFCPQSSSICQAAWGLHNMQSFKKNCWSYQNGMLGYNWKFSALPLLVNHGCILVINSQSFFQLNHHPICMQSLCEVCTDLSTHLPLNVSGPFSNKRSRQLT